MNQTVTTTEDSVDDLKQKLRLIVSFYIRYGDFENQQNVSGDGWGGLLPAIDMNKNAEERPTHKQIERMVSQFRHIGPRLFSYLVDDGDKPKDLRSTALEPLVERFAISLPNDLRGLSHSELEERTRQQYPEVYAEYTAWNRDHASFFVKGGKDL